LASAITNLVVIVVMLGALVAMRAEASPNPLFPAGIDQALGNLDPCIHFAILSDFVDAQSEHMPGDEAILAAAETGMAGLARQLGDGTCFLLHRRRQWNEAEQRWMGWERKRGKIEEFTQDNHHQYRESTTELVNKQSGL
jgi:hypothetical protein